MKTIKIISTISLFLAFSLLMQGQIKKTKKVKVIKRMPSVTYQTKTEKKCLPMDIKLTEDILRDKIGRTLKIYMDKDYGFVEMMGEKKNVNFGEFKLKKPGHNWVYFLNDVKSEVTRVKYNGEYFVLSVSFESNGNEIKGKCPGCKVGKDKRAPDINWEKPKLQIILKPVAYKYSFNFEIAGVGMLGKLKLNGPTQKFFPPIATFFRDAIARKIKHRIYEILNKPTIKNMMANAFKLVVKRIGIEHVRGIDFRGNNIYLCNYP